MDTKVERNAIQLPKKIGDIVSFWSYGGKTTGEITKLHPETGEYTVFCKTLGHVREGKGIYGFVVKADKIL
jgi:hypothetical protein